MIYSIVNIKDIPHLISTAAEWFSAKWGVPIQAYVESMNNGISGESGVPSWYVALADDSSIIGGVGIIENDFHDRVDLTPNICALFVEESSRNKGLAGDLLKRVVNDMESVGIDTLYLLTDHDNFYERYGWSFYCMAQGDGEEQMSRMYIHKK